MFLSINVPVHCQNSYIIDCLLLLVVFFYHTSIHTMPFVIAFGMFSQKVSHNNGFYSLYSILIINYEISSYIVFLLFIFKFESFFFFFAVYRVVYSICFSRQLSVPSWFLHLCVSSSYCCDCHEIHENMSCQV